MPFPSLTEIKEALQNPQVSFINKRLASGTLTNLTDPIRDSGQYAAVTQIRLQGKDFALRIPIRSWENSGPRYRMIESEICSKSSAFVDCQLLSAAIKVPVRDGPHHDVVVMEWVYGTELAIFVKEAAERGAIHDLEQLRESLQQACNELQNLRVSHGDLSPRNVLVQGSADSNPVTIKLVDYDFVSHPSLNFTTRIPQSPTRHPARPDVSDTSTDLFAFHLYDTVLETLILRPEVIRQLDGDDDQTLFISFSDPTAESSMNLEILRAVNPTGVSRLETLATGPYLDTPACASLKFDVPGDTLPSSDWRLLKSKSGKQVSVFGYVRKHEGGLVILEMPTPNNQYTGVVVSLRRGRQQAVIAIGEPLIAVGTIRERGGQIMIDQADVATPGDDRIREKVPKGWMRKHIATTRKKLRDKLRRENSNDFTTPQNSKSRAATAGRPDAIEPSSGLRFPPFDGSGPQRRSFTEPPPMGIDITKQYIASMQTSLGKIEVSLNASAAPRTVNNFIFLALHHFYDGLIFHRVVKNHSIYSGDPTGVGVGGPGYTFDDGRATGEPYKVGSVAMAHTGRNTLGSQFFIVSGPDGCVVPSVYTMFGRVTKGLRTLEKIQSVPTPRFLDARTYRPVTDVVIESITISIRS
jgi:cyclophilin family peptidyl-prolyl cis-trans isomerase